jgi:WD40 repeat protein
MVAFTPDGAYLAGASDDNFARVHEVATGRIIASLQHGDDVLIARWDRKGERLLTSSRDGTARIWQVREIVLQADSSLVFTIAPPPPAFARFATTGDTLDIGESTTLSVRLEGAQFLDLANIDSVRLRIEYDPSILYRTGTSFTTVDVIRDVVTDTAGIRRSREQLEIHLALPTADTVLGTIDFTATLGQDSVTALRITRVTQIGSGPGMRIETTHQPVLVRGICREGQDPRLYTSLGTPLILRWRVAAEGIRVSCDLAETAPAHLWLYDVLGRVLWTSAATIDEQRLRIVERTLPPDVLTGIGILVVETPTQVMSSIVAGGSR